MIIYDINQSLLSLLTNSVGHYVAFQTILHEKKLSSLE